MKAFSPKINRTFFKEQILDLQGAEGNKIEIVKRIQTEINHSTELGFFELFIKICNNHNIIFNAFQEQKDNGEIFKIVLTKNGHDLYTMTYKDKNKDITVELANKLYDALWIQINNKVFIEQVKGK